MRSRQPSSNFHDLFFFVAERVGDRVDEAVGQLLRLFQSALLVVLRDGAALSDALVAEIRARVREDCSPRHVPSEIVEIV